MQRAYIDTKETAALLRQALKEAFPGVKFSVRIDRYSMGSSIDIRWTDGPTSKAVEAIVYTFKGDYFDGMTDYHGSVYHLLDGKSVHFSGSIGTHRDFSAGAEAAVKGAWDQLSKGERWHLADKLDCRMWENELEDEHPYGWRTVLHVWDFYGKPAQPSATCARVQIAGDDGYRGSFGAAPEPEPQNVIQFPSTTTLQ